MTPRQQQVLEDLGRVYGQTDAGFACRAALAELAHLRPTPEAGSPAEDDAKLIERLEIAARVEDELPQNGSTYLSALLREAAARLRARPQQTDGAK